MKEILSIVVINTENVWVLSYSKSINHITWGREVTGKRIGHVNKYKVLE